MTTTTTTTIAPRPVPAHLVAVVSDGFEFLAECSCGWASDWHADTEGADAAGVEHREVAVGPPDAMDRLMTGLLDLQDDLAATVVWLAENWSADLPSLGWYANGSDRDTDRPVLWVIGACDPDELAPAAVVLDAALTDDPPAGEGRIRYRRAARDIGRVRIEVFTPLDRCEAAEAAR
jgi:hypothetical protein